MAKRSPRAIGTSAETALVRWLQDMGWSDARRQPLYGSQDQGDIIVCEQPRVLIECKAGAQADTASAAMIDTWLAQTDRERSHAQAIIGALVVRRFRKPPALWDCWMPMWAMVHLDTGARGCSDIPVRMSLADFSDLLRRWVG